MTPSSIVRDPLVVRSRDRVKAYGEVLTPRHLVDRMLDLVRTELETGDNFVDSTFLEPAAGDGNFLVAIVHRKLRTIEKRLPRTAWERESLYALASIYGIELLEDNHREAKAMMLEEFSQFHRAHDTSCEPGTDLHRAAAFLVDTNIVQGDTLTAQTVDGSDITFSWWDRAPGTPGMVQRRPFTLASLRDDGFDFTEYASYEPCPIERVYEEALADG